MTDILAKMRSVIKMSGMVSMTNGELTRPKSEITKMIIVQDKDSLYLSFMLQVLQL